VYDAFNRETGGRALTRRARLGEWTSTITYGRYCLEASTPLSFDCCMLYPTRRSVVGSPHVLSATGVLNAHPIPHSKIATMVSSEQKRVVCVWFIQWYHCPYLSRSVKGRQSLHRYDSPSSFELRFAGKEQRHGLSTVFGPRPCGSVGAPLDTASLANNQ